MNIKNIKISENLKEAIKKAAQEMINKKEESRALEDPFSSYVVSANRLLNDNLFYFYDGKNLGVPDTKKIFVFFEKL